MEGSTVEQFRAEISPLRLSLYDAARQDGYADGWQTKSASAADEVSEIEEIVNRVRDLSRNGSLSTTIIEVLTNRIVQPGINLSIQGDGPSLKAIKELIYQVFYESNELDYDGECSFQTLISQLVSEAAEGGGCLALRIYDKNAILGFRIKLVEQSFIARSVSDQTGKTRRGIEYDSGGRKVAYMLQSHQLADEGTLGKRKLIRYRVADVAHFYHPPRIGADIGLPWISHLVPEIRQLEDFIYNTNIRNRNASAISSFIETTERAHGGSDHSPGSNAFADDEAESARGESEDMDDRGFAITTRKKAFERRVSEDRYTSQFAELRPGINYVLRYGEKVTVPKVPDAPDFRGFHKPRLQGIARATGGASYEDISGDFSESSFSAARMSEAQPRLWVQKKREILRTRVLAKIWQWTLEGLKLRGYDTTGIWHRWEMPEAAPINPKEDILMMESQIGANAAAVSEYIRRSGRDPDAVFAEIAEERKKMKDLGITAEPKQ